jgi:hypothetical protein
MKPDQWHERKVASPTFYWDISVKKSKFNDIKNKDSND